jgi:hypothetical protein
MFNFLRPQKKDYLIEIIKYFTSLYHVECTDDEIENIGGAIRAYARDPFYEPQRYQNILLPNGYAFVIALLVEHSLHCNPDNREAMISLLRKIKQPIFDDLVYFINGAQERRNIEIWMGAYERHLDGYFSCARYTAFEALVERALEGKEHPRKVLNYISDIKNDTNSMISRALESAKHQLRQKIDEGMNY